MTPLRLSAATPFRAGWLLVVVATTLARAWTVSRWSWFQDDWVYLEQTQHHGFWSYLTLAYNSHLQPAVFLVVRLATDLDPLDHAWATVSTALLGGSVVVTWGLAFVEMFGERLRLLAPLALLGLGPAATSLSLWWAAALQYLPMQALMGLTVWFSARLAQRGWARRDVVGLTASYVLALAVWEKSLLLLLPMLGVGLLLREGPLLARLRPAARPLLASLAISIAYLAVYVVVPREEVLAATAQHPHARSPGATAAFFWHGLVDLLLPSLVGGPFQPVSSPYAQYAAAPQVEVVLMILAFGGVLFVALRHRRDAWLAVAMAVAYATASWGTVLTSSRYDEIGVQAARVGRYVADPLPVALLAALFLVTPLRTRSVEETWRRPGSMPLRSWLRPAGCVACLSVTLAAMVMSAVNWHRTEPSSPQPWASALITDAQRAGSATVLDGPAPPNVIHPIFFYGRANVSDLLSPLDLPLRYNLPTRSYLVLRGDGHLVRGLMTHPAAASVDPGPVPGCGYRVAAGTTVHVPLTIPLYRFAWVVELHYLANADASIEVATVTRHIAVRLTATPDGVPDTRELAVSDAVNGLDLTATGGTVCVVRALVGGLSPSP